MGWSAGSSPQPFIMGTVLPLLLPFILSLCLGVVGWGRGWEGYYCTTVGKIQYLHSNPLFSTVLNFLLRKIPLSIYPLWIWTPTVDIFIKFHSFWFSYVYVELSIGGEIDWLVMVGDFGLECLGEIFSLSSWWCSLGHKARAISALVWVLKIAKKIPAVDFWPCCHRWADGRVQYFWFHKIGFDCGVNILIFLLSVNL